MKQNEILDENLYWLSNKKHSYENLNELGKVTLKSAVIKGSDGNAVVKISNPTAETAFFIRLKIMNAKDELVLPSYFTDNFFTLLPGEEKEVILDCSAYKSKKPGEDFRLVTEGWNAAPAEVRF
jgi:hypothetical protein